ncbi:hypothetical protein PVC01_000056400 [Plasmodium vivax]|uniref:VIR protein n=1 Tax=Plasmodium vivax TaxID=5855 RepID=A0A1G4E920_PLAVI|nr:hypothetical protein PVC01_000056400 [Plasmodium vivax]
MTLEPYEEDCKLSKFIKNLDNAKGEKRLSFEDEIKITDLSQRDNVLTFFSKLKENYSSITTYNVNIRNQCCTYLNYWLDQKKEEKEKVESYINDEVWELVDKLWNRLNGNNVFFCKRKRHNIDMDHKKTCIDFMVYCVNRDELQKHCEQDDQEGFKDKYCTNFNDFTNKYYEEFKSKIKCLEDSNNDIHYNWSFSDSCTLHNMAKTFPKYDNESKTILEDQTRAKIKKCESHEDSGTINCYMLDGVPVTLEELPTIDVIPLKYGIYVGSSFIGFFSLGLYLYKKTRHPSLIRTNSSRENKINKNTDKQFSHEKEKKSNSKNKDYKFSYNPTQN